LPSHVSTMEQNVNVNVIYHEFNIDTVLLRFMYKKLNILHHEQL